MFVRFTRRVLAAFLVAMVAAGAPGDMALAQDGAKVRGQSSSARRGGYSYSQADAINTYGDSRGRFGSSRSLRDPNLDRQTNFGPFDHGFFFSSGMGLHGGDSPYLR
jgi:hypothetical protein